MGLLVNIDVDDLERGIAFYTAAFQLRVGRRLGPTVVELVGTDAAIYLLEKPAGTPPYDGATTPRSYARHWTPVHLDFVVDDIEAALARAVAAGATHERPIATHAWGRITLVVDPFGHGVCLLQFSERGYDAIAIA
ncbi:MAG TPA: VOC family protein [Nannocystaceae bacterium]|nr:VOC family protein [Nannocystaceae bacterium]